MSKPIATYRDRVHAAKRTFLLYERKVVVQATARWRGYAEVPFDLEKVDPEYIVDRSRSPIVGPGSFVLAAGFVFLLILGLRRGQPEFTVSAGVILGSLAVFFTILGVRYIGRIEVYAFRSAPLGQIAFTVARSGPERERFDGFIEQLVSRIEACRKQPAQRDGAAAAGQP